MFSGSGATGFEQELLALLAFMYDHDVRNVLWLTTDGHFAAVFHHRPIAADSAWGGRPENVHRRVLSELCRR